MNLNLFLTGVRIVQTQGEAAARLWYASLTSTEKERLASETTAANAAIAETVNQAVQDTLTAWQTFLTAWQTFAERWNIGLTTPHLPESPSSSTPTPPPTETAQHPSLPVCH